MIRRPAGAGSVEPSRGKWRARVRVAGQAGKPTLGTYATSVEAHQALDAYFLDRAERDGESAGKITLRTVGQRFLKAREMSNVRGIAIERDRWNAHILTCHFADWPLDEITTRDVRMFRDRLSAKHATKSAPGGTKAAPRRVSAKRLVSRSTVKNTINLLRQAFAWAVEEDLIASNPAYGVKLKRDMRTDDPWTFLSLAEQRAIFRCAGIPEPERLIIQFAIGTGMRRGELWCLKRSDVNIGERKVFVRYGSPNKPPKSGKTRWVPMTALALDAAKRWLALLPKYAARNPLGLMFPTRRGLRRYKRVFRAEWWGADGKKLTDRATLFWPDMLRAAGITDRPVRFHDLRHTAGSSLVAGWWGPPLTLIAVRDFLGHAQISTTERYAHLAGSSLAEAVYATSLAGPHAAHAPKLAESEGEL